KRCRHRLQQRYLVDGALRDGRDHGHELWLVRVLGRDQPDVIADLRHQDTVSVTLLVAHTAASLNASVRSALPGVPESSAISKEVTSNVALSALPNRFAGRYKRESNTSAPIASALMYATSAATSSSPMVEL